MELTGNCRKAFEKWYIITYFNHLALPLSTQERFGILDSFYGCFEAMRYGVYVDFFDSLGTRIDLISVGEPTMSGFKFFGYRFLINGFKVNSTYTKTRRKVRTKSIKEGNKLYNK
jgi:hypothetical protein